MNLGLEDRIETEDNEAHYNQQFSILYLIFSILNYIQTKYNSGK